MVEPSTPGGPAEAAVDDRVRDAEAADAAAVGARVAELQAAAERAVDDVEREIAGLIEGADGGAADVRAARVAPVVEEARIHDLEAAPAREDRAAAVRILAGRVAVDEGQVLHGQARVILVVAV